MKKILCLFAFIMVAIAANAQEVTPAKAKPDGTYRVVVSFASRASGPDREGLKKIKELIATYEKKYKKPLHYTIGHYGREGETDYAFDMQGWSAKKANKFIAKLKLEMPKFDVVTVAENTIPYSTKMRR